jgi:pimeloyl-ACP methyl ester carboxylesterase
MALIGAGGTTIEYVREGDGEAVLLCSPSWWPLDGWRLSGIPQLRDHYDVVAFNFRGIGASPGTPTDYTVPSLADDVLALLDALEIARAHLIGFAIGGAIALQAARTRPARVASLVIAAVGAGESPRATRTVPEAVRRELAEAGYREHIRGHALNDDFAFSPASYRAHPERAAALADALWEHAGPEQEYLKHVLALQGHDTLADLAAVQQPALVLVGAEDTVRRGASTPLDAAQALTAGLPHAELEIVPGVRHMLFWEAPESWQRVRRFLAEHPANARQ